MDLIELVSKDEILDIYDKSIARLAEANGAELDYTNEEAYFNSVGNWYQNYLNEQLEKAGAAGKYDEYFDVINDFVLQILDQVYFNNNQAYINQQVSIYAPGASPETDEPVGQTHFYGGYLYMKIDGVVPSTKGNPFFDISGDEAEDRNPTVLKCPDAVITLLKNAGYNPINHYQYAVNIKIPVDIKWGGENE